MIIQLDIYLQHLPDLREQYEVRLEEGLDAFVVVDGLPIVTEANKTKLVKFLVKKLNEVGRTKADAVFMPMDEQEEPKSQGWVFTTTQATTSHFNELQICIRGI